MHCSNCGATVTGAFCGRCGTAAVEPPSIAGSSGPPPVGSGNMPIFGKADSGSPRYRPDGAAAASAATGAVAGAGVGAGAAGSGAAGGFGAGSAAISAPGFGVAQPPGITPIGGSPLAPPGLPPSGTPTFAPIGSYGGVNPGTTTPVTTPGVGLPSAPPYAPGGMNPPPNPWAGLPSPSKLPPMGAPSFGAPPAPPGSTGFGLPAIGASTSAAVEVGKIIAIILGILISLGLVGGGLWYWWGGETGAVSGESVLPVIKNEPKMIWSLDYKGKSGKYDWVYDPRQDSADAPARLVVKLVDKYLLLDASGDQPRLISEYKCEQGAARHGYFQCRDDNNWKLFRLSDGKLVYEYQKKTGEAAVFHLTRGVIFLAVMSPGSHGDRLVKVSRMTLDQKVIWDTEVRVPSGSGVSIEAIGTSLNADDYAVNIGNIDNYYHQLSGATGKPLALPCSGELHRIADFYECAPNSNSSNERKIIDKAGAELAKYNGVEKGFNTSESDTSRKIARALATASGQLIALSPKGAEVFKVSVADSDGTGALFAGRNSVYYAGAGYSPSDGKKIWQEMSHLESKLVGGNDDQIVVWNKRENYIAALKAKTGKEQWRANEIARNVGGYSLQQIRATSYGIVQIAESNGNIRISMWR